MKIEQFHNTFFKTKRITNKTKQFRTTSYDRTNKLTCNKAITNTLECITMEIEQFLN